MATIQLSGITRTFKTTTAVADVDLTIEDGDFLVLLGPSGCGKTTLLRMIAGLIEPTQGTIALDGADITRTPAKQRDLAMVFQSYALYPHLSVRKNLAFPLTIKKLPKSEIAARVEEVARSLEIDHLLDRKPKELSGGQRQRVAVGRALVREPKAFLMDEPLSNLDAKLRTQTRRELTELHRKLRATFVYVTHDQIEAMTMATKIVVLNAGSIEQVGTPEEVYDRPASTFVASFVGSPATNLINARVFAQHGSIRVEAPGLSGDLWPGTTDPFDATLGIRPEHLRISDESPGSRGVTLEARVALVENLGSELIVDTYVGDERVQVRAERGTSLSPGDRVALHTDTEHLHLFDRATGQRLEWVDDSKTPAELDSRANLAAV